MGGWLAVLVLVVVPFAVADPLHPDHNTTLDAGYRWREANNNQTSVVRLACPADQSLRASHRTTFELSRLLTEGSPLESLVNNTKCSIQGSNIHIKGPPRVEQGCTPHPTALIQSLISLTKHLSLSTLPPTTASLPPPPPPSPLPPPTSPLAPTSPPSLRSQITSKAPPLDPSAMDTPDHVGSTMLKLVNPFANRASPQPPTGLLLSPAPTRDFDNNTGIGRGGGEGRSHADIASKAAQMVMVREEVCLRRVKGDISAAVSSQVFASAMTQTFAQTKGFMQEIFDAIGAPLLEALGYIIGLFLVGFMGVEFLDKIVGAMTQMIPGALEVVLVPLVSDMTIQTLTKGVVYAVCDGSVPAIVATMRVQIMASMTSYLAMSAGPQLQHRISHQTSQALIRETEHKVTHHVVEGLTHSVTHVMLHKVIHQFLCIYCYYHGQYCERCFYYGETVPLLQNSATKPKSFGPFGTDESGALADMVNYARSIVPMVKAGAQVGKETEMENLARQEMLQHEKANPAPSHYNDPWKGGLEVTLGAS